MAELNNLRMEAMTIFEQCLTNGDNAPMVTFIEQQLAQTPPRLQLLRDLADDLQQRLLSLREYHFDVRDRVVRTFNEGYAINIALLTPPADAERYHYLTTEQVLAFAQQQTPLPPDDLPLLRKMVEASLQMAAQLSTDIKLTEHLYNLVVDWVEALSIELIKRHWEQHPRRSDTNSMQLMH